MLGTLDDPAGQGLSGYLYTVTLEHLLEAVQRQAVGIFGGQQHGQHAGAGQALFDQLCRLVSRDRSCFTAFAGIHLAEVTDHPDLHRDDLQLLAGFLANGLLAATAVAGQFMLGQLMDDLDAWQFGRQRLALATLLDRLRRDDFFLCFGRRFSGKAFSFVEHRQLGRLRIYALFRLAAEQALTK